MELLGMLALIVGFVALDLLAVRFGHDSRDGFRASGLSVDVARSIRSDPAYDEELASEMRETRQRRISRGRVVDSQPRDAAAELAPAA